MFRTLPILLLALSITGCSKHNFDVADPVVGPVPPRVANATVMAAQSGESDIKQVSYAPDKPLEDTVVVARVNGRAILAGEVLDFANSNNQKIGVALKQARSQATPEQYREIQEQVIKNFLPSMIEQALMYDAVKSKLTSEQLEKVEEQLNVFFDQEVDRMKEQFGVDSAAELEAILQSQGMSLESMRRMFGERTMSGEYVRGRMGEDAPITRQDLLKEYESRKDEFAEPAQVKWQQLQVSKTKHGAADAEEKLKSALRELSNGADFSDVVKRYSDGPLAKNGGHWDWTQPQSIARDEVREKLLSTPIQSFSNVIETSDMFYVVKVTGRRDKGYKPFEDQQDKLRKEVAERRKKVQAEKIMAELKESAVIEVLIGDEADAKAILQGTL